MSATERPYPTAQDFIDAQENVSLDGALNRYYNDPLFHYRVDMSVGLALRNRRDYGVREASENEKAAYRIGAIFALVLDEQMRETAPK